MTLILLTFAIIIPFFLASNVLIFKSLGNLFKRSKDVNTHTKKISVVISLKNESTNISSLISSLNTLNYPVENYEVILVDDQSTDDTFEKIKFHICNKPNYKLIKAENKPLPGKKGALELGIQNSSHPYIAITDADCKPEPGWLSAFASKFENYQMVFGIAPLTAPEPTFISNLACFENLRSSILTFSMANLKFPYSAAARNFGFEKDAFYSIGGYNKTTETLSGDDDLLLREAVKHNLRIGTITRENTFVFSDAKTNLNEYITQKTRHTSTSNHYLLKHKLMLAFWHIINLLFLFSPLLFFISPYLIIPFIVKMLSDTILIKNFQSRFSYNFKLSQIFYLQIIYEFFIILNYLNATFEKGITWK